MTHHLVDFHIHSNRSSDGDFSPAELLRFAKESGFRAISISDHDTVAAYPEALEASREIGVELIPSVEVTTLFDGREFHLLLPFMNWESKVLGGLLTKVAEARVAEAQERVRKLQEIGFDISWEEVTAKSDSTPPLGVTIAQVLLEKARRQSDPRFQKYFEEKHRLFAPYVFYRDYFLEGKPAFIPKKNVSLLQVLDHSRESEGVPVLAHPGAYFQQTTKQDLLQLKEKGLVGLEVFTTYHDPEQVEFYQALAQEIDLVATAGSDFHGKIKPHIAFGTIRDGNYRMAEELRRRRN